MRGEAVGIGYVSIGKVWPLRSVVVCGSVREETLAGQRQRFRGARFQRAARRGWCYATFRGPHFPLVG